MSSGAWHICGYSFLSLLQPLQGYIHFEDIAQSPCNQGCPLPSGKVNTPGLKAFSPLPEGRSSSYYLPYHLSSCKEPFCQPSGRPLLSHKALLKSHAPSERQRWAYWPDDKPQVRVLPLQYHWDVCGLPTQGPPPSTSRKDILPHHCQSGLVNGQAR